MQHERQAIFDALDDLPLNEKLAHLVWSCLVDDPQASCEILIEVALIAAKRLRPDQQTAVCWYLSEAKTELEAKWN